MNYIYNIKVNLKEELINFYEWSKKDNIEVIKRCPVYVLSDSDYINIKDMKVQVEEKFIKNLKLSKNICLFCNNIDAVCVLFDNKGIISKISSLSLEEEQEILNEINLINIKKIKYKLINKNNNYKHITRKEEKIIVSLENYVKEHKNNKEIIDYLYYEWFNKDNCNNKYEELLKVIMSEYGTKHEELNKLIELIECKNV